MRTWGRVPNPEAGGRIGIDFTIGVSAIGLVQKPLIWVEVDTDPNGYNDAVNLTTLAQVLKLNLGESPFFANFGIPAKNSVLQQIAPDFYVSRTQQQFANFFSSLSITKVTAAPEPLYNVRVIAQDGSIINENYPGPVPT